MYLIVMLNKHLGDNDQGFMCKNSLILTETKLYLITVIIIHQFFKKVERDNLIVPFNLCHQYLTVMNNRFVLELNFLLYDDVCQWI